MLKIMNQMFMDEKLMDSQKYFVIICLENTSAYTSED